MFLPERCQSVGPPSRGPPAAGQPPRRPRVLQQDKHKGKHLSMLSHDSFCLSQQAHNHTAQAAQLTAALACASASRLLGASHGLLGGVGSGPVQLGSRVGGGTVGLPHHASAQASGAPAASGGGLQRLGGSAGQGGGALGGASHALACTRAGQAAEHGVLQSSVNQCSPRKCSTGNSSGSGCGTLPDHHHHPPAVAARLAPAVPMSSAR